MTWRSKVNIQSGSWMYTSHPLLVIDQSAKFDMPMSKLTEVTGRTWQKPLNLTWGQRSTLNRDHECTWHIVWWWYIYVPNMVSQCQSKKKLWAGHENMSKTLYFSSWGQSSRLYLDHECTRHIVLWWYTHVPNMVGQCQTKKKIMSRIQNHVKNPINLTLRSMFKVVFGLWI